MCQCLCHDTNRLNTMFCTPGEAAAILGVNRLTVRRWVQAGRLSGETVGRITLVERCEVERMRVERGSASGIGAK